MLFKPFHGRLFFEADGGSNAGGAGEAGGSNASGGEPAFAPITSEEQLRDWKSSTRTHLIAEIRADLKKEQDAAIAAETAQREREAEIAKGNFETVRTSLETERDGFKTERDALSGRVDRYAAVAAQRVETLRADLPAEALEDFPAAADALDQLEWLEARTALLAKLAPVTGEKRPVTPKTPAAQGNVKPDIREALRGIRYT